MSALNINLLNVIDILVSESDLTEFEKVVDQWEKEQEAYNEKESLECYLAKIDVFYTNQDVR